MPRRDRHCRQVPKPGVGLTPLLSGEETELGNRRRRGIRISEVAGSSRGAREEGRFPAPNYWRVT